VEVVEDAQGAGAQSRFDGCRAEPDLGLEGAAFLAVFELEAGAGTFEVGPGRVGPAEAVGTAGEPRDADRTAVRVAGRVFDHLQQRAAGRHLGEHPGWRAAAAGRMVEDDRVGRGGEDLDRQEDGGQRPIDLVPADRKRIDGGGQSRHR